MREHKYRAWFERVMHEVAILGIMGYDHDLFDSVGYRFTAHHEKCVIMQFTGLRDKDGKEIYERDVVECDNDNWWHGRSDGCPPTYKVVVPDIECFYENSDHPGIDLDRTVQQGRVIGNIHENPELIKTE